MDPGRLADRDVTAALLLLDVAATQSYVFRSNALREAAGASYLVDAATRAWLFDALDGRLDGRHNAVRDRWAADPYDPDVTLAADGARAEVVTAGGGTATVLFRDPDDARAVARDLSYRVLKQAPGLDLVATVHQVEGLFEGGSFYATLVAARAALARHKAGRARPTWPTALGVTREGDSTGTPVVGMAGEVTDKVTDVPERMRAKRVSAETAAKLRVVAGGPRSDVGRRLHAMVPAPDGFGYALDVEEAVGTAEDHRHLAVVHADADGLGATGSLVGEGLADAEAIRAVRSFSVAVAQATNDALGDIVNGLAEAFEPVTDANGRRRWVLRHEGSRRRSTVLELVTARDGAPLLPFRPIVSGGDDVTFVADGTLGLSLAARYAERFAHHARGGVLEGLSLSASAGVAVVGVRSPFARAYGLADALCKRAKTYRAELLRELKERGELDDGRPAMALGCLDWLEAVGGTEHDVEAAVQGATTAVYASGGGAPRLARLTLRPVTVGTSPVKAERSWPVVCDGVRAFQSSGVWSRRQQGVLADEVLPRGEDAAKRHVQNVGLPLPPLPSLDPPGKYADGSLTPGNRSPYADALGLADRVVLLSDDP
ncbi:MAG: hypothetical protein AAGI91_15320 [Bacteroidota bacterium]